jgi:tRNA dimethylallyltransferase
LARIAYALLGPTASGKSALALKLAQKLPLEIVSLDSALVYRGMDIGTAKPGVELRAQVPHHLIDIIDPDRSYSAGRWREDAIRTVLEIFERKTIPMLVGGTMLYYRALVAGLDSLPQADARVRAELDADAAQRGWPALHADLATVDPAAAQRIKPNDPQRIQRALEVWKVTGKPLSALQGVARPALPFEVKGIALLPDRALLHQRIEQRFDAMLRLGLVDEVKGLRKKYRLDAAMPSMRAVGYRQVWEFLEGEIDQATMRTRAVTATRQLAKRQLTWLRSFPDLVRLDPGGAQDAAVALHLLLDEGRQLVGR